MRLNPFSKESNSIARRERQEQLERSMADGLRAMASLFQKVAERIEARRLSRNGYREQNGFLERTRPPR